MKIFQLLILLTSCICVLDSRGQSDQTKFDSLKRIFTTKASDSVIQSQYRYLSKYSPNLDTSIYYGEIALMKAQEMGNQRAIADTYLTLSNPIRKQGDLDKAMDYVVNALKIFEEIGYDTGAAVCYNVMGVGYINMENYSTATYYLSKAVQMDSIAGRLSNLQADYGNLGEAYRLSKKLDTALLYFNKSLELAKKLNLNYGVAYSTGNIGLVYAEIGDYEKAQEMINDATQIFNTIGDRYPISVYLTYTADIYKVQGNLDLALRYAEQALQIGVEEGLKEQIRDASIKLSELYLEKEDYRKAFEFQRQYLAYRDSINNAETVQKMADLRTEFEVSQKQAEVDLLNQEKKTQQAIGWGLVFGVGLLGILAIVLYRNNQKRQRINKLLETQKHKLEEINSTKDKFFSIISHDLRGPVNSFKGISQIIKAYVSSKRTDQLIEVTEDIDKSVEGLSSLLDNLLNWAVQQQGQVPNVPEKVSLNELVTDLTNTFANMAKSKEIKLEADIQGQIDLWVDRNSTMTIIRNIVNNALKFTKLGGNVTISAREEGEYANVQIVDTGVGIAPDQLKELFQLKAKKRSWGTEGEKGLGLGLQLAYEFVEMNNGTIKVESQLDVGTVFMIKLPLFEASEVTQSIDQN